MQPIPGLQGFEVLYFVFCFSKLQVPSANLLLPKCTFQSTDAVFALWMRSECEQFHATIRAAPLACPKHWARSAACWRNLFISQNQLNPSLISGGRISVHFGYWESCGWLPHPHPLFWFWNAAEEGRFSLMGLVWSQVVPCPSAGV